MGDDNTYDFPWCYSEDPESWFVARPAREWQELTERDLVKPSLNAVNLVIFGWSGAST